MPKRIVHMLNSMGMGGIENFIMNVYRQIDKQEYQFDFILQCEEESFFEKEIKELGGKIYRIPRFEKHPLKHCQELKSILKQNNFWAFHRHTASSVVFIDLWIAKACKINKRLVHSHNTSNKGVFLNKLFRFLLSHFSTHKLACSIDAGKWLYGNRRFVVIHNGIDTKKYLFSNEIRKKLRNELNIDNNIVIGHVGRFSAQKNHLFLLRVFQKVYQKNSNYRLLLCGSGELEQEMKAFCTQQKIEEAVIFAGVRDDIPMVMQAMDIFAFPSLYEGLGIVLMEAQLTNLPCVVSNRIPKEAIYHTNVTSLEIKEQFEEEWVNTILNTTIETSSRHQVNQQLLKDYDIVSVTNDLVQIYEGE